MIELTAHTAATIALVVVCCWTYWQIKDTARACCDGPTARWQIRNTIMLPRHWVGLPFFVAILAGIWL